MTNRTSTSPFVLMLITVGLATAVLYLFLEGLSAVVDEDIADLISAATNPRCDLPGLAAYTDLVYGWDLKSVDLPAGDSEALDADILILGDSVTRGFGVEEPKRRSYPALLQQALTASGKVRVISRHPGARAHGIYARCLLPIVIEELTAKT